MRGKGGNRFCTTTELFGALFYFSILKTWATQILPHSSHFDDLVVLFSVFWNFPKLKMIDLVPWGNQFFRMKNSRKIENCMTTKGTSSIQSLGYLSFTWPFIVVAFKKKKEIVHWTITSFLLMQKNYIAKSLEDSYTQRWD